MFNFHHFFKRGQTMSEEKKERVSDQDFVVAYKRAFDAGNTIEDVAVMLGLKPMTVTVRAGKLRKDGVNLPVFPRKTTKRGKKVRDIDALNALLG
jgi:hypothetical protein